MKPEKEWAVLGEDFSIEDPTSRELAERHKEIAFVIVSLELRIDEIVGSPRQHACGDQKESCTNCCLYPRPLKRHVVAVTREWDSRECDLVHFRSCQPRSWDGL